jgi:hypothetical protein
MMNLINKKTRKQLEKTFTKVIKKHAPAIAAALVGAVASSLATLAVTETSDGEQSNLGKMVDKVKEAVVGPSDSPTDKARAVGKTRRVSDATSSTTGQTPVSNGLPS